MKKTLFASLFMIFLLGACQSPEESAEAPVTTASWDVFGEEFDASTAVPVEKVAANPAGFTGRPIAVSGMVTEVCQAMGCWMTLQVPDGENVRVVMPRDENGNYKFTLARDLSGRNAVIMGTLDESTMAEFEGPMHAAGADHHADGEAGDMADHHAEGEVGDMANHHAEGEAGDMSGHHPEGDAPMEGDAHHNMDTPELHLTASGVLVEKAL